MAITVPPEIVRQDGWRQVMFSQSAAGAADTLVADPGDGLRVVVKEMQARMSAAGTLQLLSAANAMTGIMSLAAGVPFEGKGSSRSPFLECSSSEALVLSTVTTAATGFLVYKIVRAT